MKRTICLFFCLAFFLTACSDHDKSGNPAEGDNIAPENIQMDEALPDSGPVEMNRDILGVYHGVQESYYLKNQFGEDMVINGQKVQIPQSDYQFTLLEGSKVSLQQTNMEDGSTYYYEGNYSVEKEETGRITVKCSVSDGSSSSPVYYLDIDRSDYSAVCRGSDSEPDFRMKKINAESADQTTESPPSAAVEENDQSAESPDGIYSYADESAELQITINGDVWTGKTVMITGMGSEYDDVEYEEGVVKGNTLYESSGMVEIGYVSGRTVTTSMGDRRVTLHRN